MRYITVRNTPLSKGDLIALRGPIKVVEVRKNTDINANKIGFTNEVSCILRANVGNKLVVLKPDDRVSRGDVAISYEGGYIALDNSAGSAVRSLMQRANIAVVIGEQEV